MRGSNPEDHGLTVQYVNWLGMLKAQERTVLAELSQFHLDKPQGVQSNVHPLRVKAHQKLIDLKSQI